MTTLDASTWNGLRTVPADGTFLRAGTGGIIFRIAGGAPIRVNSWAAVGGTHPYTTVDPVAITDAGTGGDWNHLHAVPADGTFLRAGTGGIIFRIAGGAPIRVNSWATVGGTAALHHRRPRRHHRRRNRRRLEPPTRRPRRRHLPPRRNRRHHLPDRRRSTHPGQLLGHRRRHPALHHRRPRRHHTTPEPAATGTTYTPSPPTAPSSAPEPADTPSIASPAAHPCT